MVAALQHPYLSPEAYLEWELLQEQRYEYIDGFAYAMTGGTLPHSDLAFNFATILRNQLPSRCKARTSDAKVGLTERGPFFYPDVSVSCDPRDRTAIKYIQFPSLIVEVLSPATEAYDRGGKFTQYRRLETLKEYVLVSSDAIAVDIFRLNANHKWELTPYVAGDEISLTSVEVKFAIDLLYEDVIFAEAAPTGKLDAEGDRAPQP